MSADTVKRVVWTFVQAFLAGFLVGIGGLAAVKDLSGAKAVLVGAITGGIAAGISAIKNVLIPEGHSSR